MKRAARVAGICYLLVAVPGGFAELVVRGSVTLPTVVAEFWMIGYLLVLGVSRREQPAIA